MTGKELSEIYRNQVSQRQAQIADLTSGISLYRAKASELARTGDLVAKKFIEETCIGGLEEKLLGVQAALARDAEMYREACVLLAELEMEAA